MILIYPIGSQPEVDRTTPLEEEAPLLEVDLRNAILPVQVLEAAARGLWDLPRRRYLANVLMKDSSRFRGIESQRRVS
jgi:hypothetical protein